MPRITSNEDDYQTVIMPRARSDEDEYKPGWGTRVLQGVKVGVIVFIGLSVIPMGIMASITTMLAWVFLAVRVIYVYIETAFLTVFDYFFAGWRYPHLGTVDYRTTMYNYGQYWTAPHPHAIYRGYRYGYGSSSDGSSSDSEGSTSSPTARSFPPMRRYLSPSDKRPRRRRSTTTASAPGLHKRGDWRDEWRAPTGITATPETSSSSSSSSTTAAATPETSSSGSSSSSSSSSSSRGSSSRTPTERRRRNSAAAALTTPSNSNKKRAVTFETPSPRSSMALRERREAENRRRFEEQEREEYEKYFLRADLANW
ncbi:hypothetical protein C8A01DRAFT_37811 [Parachaetomium inaequale]|uniref:Uncharacterized protein n=1 Tax=Parachaetomium inaequale TaxID=2588326 RepID=A0AAN6SQE2_9PEZI|nr:hypothetical protein C8A01DRAFT_37811 [Parachaetomium inaequale]